MDVLTDQGTLLLPSFNHCVPFAPGGEGFYDPRTTPTTNGAIPETFWRMDGVLRSLDQLFGIAHVPIVIDADLRNDIDWLAIADQAIIDLHRSTHISSFSAE